MGGRLGWTVLGHVPLSRGRRSLLAPLFPDSHHFLSSTGTLDGPLTSPIPLPPTFSSLPCPCMGCPRSGELPGDGKFGGVLAVTGLQALRIYF